ncbi:unnamed protein product [Urochloa decumbens]|uniref:BHLH domain-containing protein n=1 Tax=Urochloa decumbens TaxID=240449 RepID=A0ABC8ZJ79_9POAL
MDHHVAILAVDGHEGMDMENQKRHHQQQLVRERGRRIKAAAELGLARSSRGRQWGRALGRRALAVATASKDPYPFEFEVTAPSSTSTGEHEAQEKVAAASPEEEVEVEEKVALLRRLVPGGEEMAVEGLLEETADYIAALKAQVGVMRALACLLSGSGLDDLPVPGKAGAGLLSPAEKPQ